MEKPAQIVTKKQAVALGFKKIKAYPHDGFYTEEYQRGVVKLELTYKREEQLCSEVFVPEIYYVKLGGEQLEALLKALQNISVC